MSEREASATGHVPAKTLLFPSGYIGDKALRQLPHIALSIALGERDSERLSAIANEDLAKRDMLYVLSVMCYPDDECAIGRIKQALIAEELHVSVTLAVEFEIEIMLRGETYLRLAAREDPRRLLANMVETDWLAHVASGYILRRAVSMHLNEATRAAASLSSAIRMVEQWCRENGNLRGGKAQNIARNLWPKYKSVSHLWAAWFILTDADLLPPRVGFVPFMAMLCGTAQWLAEQVVQIRPNHRRRGEALLTSDDLWAIPESQVRRLEDGSPANRIWHDHLDAHDLQKKLLPRALQRL